jgi:hypothetical protein
MKKNTFWFTLPELLVWLAILVFLSYIWYVKYSDYISDSRDATRYSKINEISDLIKAYKISHTLPAPLDFIEVKANSKIIWYQWYAWSDILEKIHYSAEWKDPNDYTYFTYFITADRKSFELMWFYENEASLEYSSIFKKTYAKKVDYSIRYPYVSWDKVWIYTISDNTPIQEVSSYLTAWEVDLSWVNKNDIFNVFISNEQVYKFTWEILASKMYSITHKWQFWAPNNCPEWYIAVWWDSDFNQKWFCVAKYEMSFSELDSPWSPTNSTVNWYNYVSWKHYKSRVDYPIVKITQEQAIEACKKLWKWYHLITNNEWMTIARQIEFEKNNWRSENPWFDDTLFNWNSSDTYESRWCSDSTWPNSKITKTWDWDLNCFYKRKNYLFNGEIIWDFAWNVAEHVNKANTKSWSWFDNWRTQFYKSDWTTTNNTWEKFQDVAAAVRPSYWPLIWEDWSNWAWWVFDFDWVDNNVFIRWWSFQDDYSAWIYTLSLDMKWDWDSDYVWFRCAR